MPLCQPDYCTNTENIFVFAVFHYNENVMVSVSSVVVDNRFRTASSSKYLGRIPHFPFRTLQFTYYNIHQGMFSIVLDLQ